MSFGFHHFEWTVDTGHGPFDDFDLTNLSAGRAWASGLLAGRNFIGKTRLGEPAEEPSQLVSGVFDFIEMRYLFQQPAPTLLLHFDAGEFLQKLHLPAFQRVIFGVHAKPPTQETDFANPPTHPSLPQIRRFHLLTFLFCEQVLQKLTWARQLAATSFGVESSGGVVTILANRLKQNGVVPQSVVLGR